MNALGDLESLTPTMLRGRGIECEALGGLIERVSAGYGAALVERVEGDFFGVMGLPLRLVLELLEAAGHGYVFPDR